MPVLGDYLGVLMAEITNARLQADLESVRIAQLYASHPLLQHLPVPRFRLPSVTLDLPVAVDKIEPPSGATMPAPDLAALRRRTDEIIRQQLGATELHLESGAQGKLKHALDRIFETLKSTPLALASDATLAAERVTNTVMELMKPAESGHPAAGSGVEEALQRQIGLEFVKLQPPPPRLQVIVTTAQLKGFGPPQNLSRLQLTISEEGVEWTQTDPTDASTKRLLPE